MTGLRRLAGNLARLWGGGVAADAAGGAVPPPATMPVEHIPFVVFDFEMTGLSPARDSVLAVGGVRMRGPRILLGDTFVAEVRPHCAVRDAGVLIHGILPDEATCHAQPGPVFRSFAAYCRGQVLAGWEVGIDMAFLEAGCARHKVPVWKGEAVDVCGLALGLRAQGLCEALGGVAVKDMSLYVAARALGVEVEYAHSALGDAWMTAQVLQRLLVCWQVAQEGSGTGENTTAHAGADAQPITLGLLRRLSVLGRASRSGQGAGMFGL